MLEIGKLYSCEEYYLMLFPDKTTVAGAVRSGADVAVEGFYVEAAAGSVSAYWSKRFGKPVDYAKKNIPILVLNREGEYIEVLAGDRKGWIVLKDWLKIKEIE